jgi:hypothetical protein
MLHLRLSGLNIGAKALVAVSNSSLAIESIQEPSRTPSSESL